MAVKHFEKDGVVLCGTKGNVVEKTTVKSEVTCKRCLKKLSTPAHKEVSKKSTTVTDLDFIEHKKFGFCLDFGRDTILKVGDELDEKVGVMMFLTPAGMFSTSARFASAQVREFASENQINALKEWFAGVKASKGFVTVADIKEKFVK